MSPQQSFFLSDGLHAIVTHCEQFCMECINMPSKCAYNSDFKCITSNENICCFATGESSYPPTRLGSIGRTHYGGVPATLVPKHSQFRPPDKRIQFNRMNGCPGDPPGSYIHKFTNEKIVSSLTRLVGDPYGKEANRETTIGDTKYVIKHIN